jgi:hypothetical protein
VVCSWTFVFYIYSTIPTLSNTISLLESRIHFHFSVISAVWNSIRQEKRNRHTSQLNLKKYLRLLNILISSNLNTRLPCLSKLHVQYEHLVTITENFTRNTTYINCAQLKQTHFYDKMPILHSQDFYLDFPLL